MTSADGSEYDHHDGQQTHAKRNRAPQNALPDRGLVRRHYLPCWLYADRRPYLNVSTGELLIGMKTFQATATEALQKRAILTAIAAFVPNRSNSTEMSMPAKGNASNKAQKLNLSKVST